MEGGKTKGDKDKREVSLEKIDDVHTLSDKKLVEQIVEDKLLLEMLLKALETLTEDEMFLIDEIYFRGKSEREVSDKLKIPKTNVHRLKEKILKKLKKKIK